MTGSLPIVPNLALEVIIAQSAITAVRRVQRRVNFGSDISSPAVEVDVASTWIELTKSFVSRREQGATSDQTV